MNSSEDVLRVRFSDKLNVDLVACHLVVKKVAAEEECSVEILWPEATTLYWNQLEELVPQAPNYYQEDSPFHGLSPEDVTEFLDSAQNIMQDVKLIRAGAAERTKLLVRGMLPHWGIILDNIITRSLVNFLTLCNYEMLKQTIFLFRYRPLYRKFFPKEYEVWFEGSEESRLRRVFPFEEEICRARVSEISGHELYGGIHGAGEYFYGPRSEVLNSANWKPGEPIRGTWFDKYVIPQNELRLLREGSAEVYQYDEQLRINKVREGSREIW
jgi:hypothetical protein